jgi:hypothetical protein
MSLLTAVSDVCAVVGVHKPTTVFGNINSDRTMFEMVEVANEAAGEIAVDHRDWTALVKIATLLGNGIDEGFPLPPDYRRMLVTSDLWLSSNTSVPARFISDTNEWLVRRNGNTYSSWGEWTIYGGLIHIQPILGLGVSASFIYLDRNFVENRSPTGALSGLSERFTSDFDTFRLDERLLKLGMIYKWKALKGSPYAEDLGTFSNAMATAAGSDKPSPIIVGRTPISANTRYAYPWLVPT